MAESGLVHIDAARSHAGAPTGLRVPGFTSGKPTAVVEQSVRIACARRHFRAIVKSVERANAVVLDSAAF